MNYNKDLFDGMTVFCSIVENNGFTAAAKQLGHTPSHVSKVMARLEERLDSHLMNRTTRRISLTETGRIYYEHARRLVADAKTIEDRIASLGDVPYGELKLSVPVIFAQGCFSAWLPDYLQAYPEVSLKIDVTDKNVDMIAQGFDLVIRIGNLPDSDFIARELFRTSFPTLATPEYLKKNGTPQHPDELTHYDLITFFGSGTNVPWQYRDNYNSSITVNAVGNVICNESNMERTLLLAGQGITQVPGFAYATELSQGKLVRILADYEQPSVGVHLMYPKRDYLPMKTRSMIEFVMEKTAAYATV